MSVRSVSSFLLINASSHPYPQNKTIEQIIVALHAVVFSRAEGINVLLVSNSISARPAIGRRLSGIPVYMIAKGSFLPFQPGS